MPDISPIGERSDYQKYPWEDIEDEGVNLRFDPEASGRPGTIGVGAWDADHAIEKFASAVYPRNRKRKDEGEPQYRYHAEINGGEHDATGDLSLMVEHIWLYGHPADQQCTEHCTLGFRNAPTEDR